VRYNKETSETTTSVTYEEEIVFAEPTTADEYNKEFTERFYKHEENKIMGKVKGMLEEPSEPMISYYPSYIPIEKELLYAMSQCIVALRHKDEPIADLPECIEVVDDWLTKRYQDIESVDQAGNEHAQTCEEKD
jgi:hypothetical protein